MALAAGCGTANPDATISGANVTAIKATEAMLSMLVRSGKLRALADTILSFGEDGGKFKADSIANALVLEKGRGTAPRPDYALWQYVFAQVTGCGMHGGKECVIFGKVMWKDGRLKPDGNAKCTMLFQATVRRAAALPPRALGDRVSRSPPSQLPDGWSTAWVPPTVEDYAWADRMKALVDAVGLALETAARAPALSQLVDAHAALSASAADGTPWATKYSRLGPHIASLEAAMVQPAPNPDGPPRASPDLRTRRLISDASPRSQAPADAAGQEPSAASAASASTQHGQPVRAPPSQTLIDPHLAHAHAHARPPRARHDSPPHARATLAGAGCETAATQRRLAQLVDNQRRFADAGSLWTVDRNHGVDTQGHDDAEAHQSARQSVAQISTALV